MRDIHYESMKLSIGIVGLPNVGKSTLFNLLTKQSILVANYPFATIDPNVGVVEVPDERVEKLVESLSKETYPLQYDICLRAPLTNLSIADRIKTVFLHLLNSFTARFQEPDKEGIVMSEEMATPYVFTRAERPVFAEIYFPKKVAYQGTIFTALEDGLKKEVVKGYLKENAAKLLDELGGYPDLLNSSRPEGVSRKRRPVAPSLEEAVRRIEMYQSHFTGWSMYEVNGVFLGEGGEVDEELTQVIRLMFRFRSRFHDHAERARCGDALRMIFFWFMDYRGRLWEQKPWDALEKKRFLDSRSPWPVNKRRFAKEHFEAVMKEATWWLNDCALFTYGYLVRRFSQTVLERRRREDEIWVTSLFDLNLNTVVKRITPAS